MRSIARVAALLMCLFALVGLAEVVAASGSWSAYGYGIGLAVLGGSQVLRPKLRWSLAGLVIIGATGLLRIALVDRGRSLRLRSVASDSSRVLDRLVDERDLAVVVAQLMGWTRGLTQVGLLADPEVDALPKAMKTAYAELRRSEGDIPSPVLATSLGLQSPGSFDMITFGDPAAAAGTVVFLHGFSGSFVLPCWIVARAAAKAGFATVCPATGWRGDWWSPSGERILAETQGALKQLGAQRLVLAGLSNGAFAASVRAGESPRVFAGLLLISGASPEAQPVSIPVLAIQGRRDAAMPAAVTRQYALRTGATYVELDSGHFALLTHEAEATSAITSWLASLAG